MKMRSLRTSKHHIMRSICGLQVARHIASQKADPITRLSASLAVTAALNDAPDFVANFQRMINGFCH